ATECRSPFAATSAARGAPAVLATVSAIEATSLNVDSPFPVARRPAGRAARPPLGRSLLLADAPFVLRFTIRGAQGTVEQWLVEVPQRIEECPGRRHKDSAGSPSRGRPANTAPCRCARSARRCRRSGACGFPVRPSRGYSPAR